MLVTPVLRKMDAEDALRALDLPCTRANFLNFQGIRMTKDGTE